MYDCLVYAIPQFSMLLREMALPRANDEASWARIQDEKYRGLGDGK